MEIIAIIAVLAVIFFVLKGLFFPNKYERNATRRCVHCKSSIPYTATVCPVCHLNPGTDHGADAKVSFKRNFGGLFKLLLIAGVVVVIIVLLYYAGIDVLAIFKGK